MAFLRFNGICYSLFYNNGHFKITFYIVQSEINLPIETIHSVLSHTYLYEEVENFTVSDSKIMKDNLIITFLGEPYHIVLDGKNIKTDEKNFNEAYQTLLKHFTGRDKVLTDLTNREGTIIKPQQKMLDDHILKQDPNIIANADYTVNQNIQDDLFDSHHQIIESKKAVCPAKSENIGQSIMHHSFITGQQEERALLEKPRNILDDDQLEMEKSRDFKQNLLDDADIFVHPTRSKHDIKVEEQKKENILAEVEKRKAKLRKEKTNKMKEKVEKVKEKRANKKAILLTLSEMNHPIDTHREPTKDFTPIIKSPKRRKRRTYFRRK